MTAFLALPFYLLGRLAGRLPGPTYTVGVNTGDRAVFYVLLLPALAGALNVLLVFQLCRRLGAGRLAAVATATALALGTLNWRYGTALFAHTLSAFFVLLLCLTALRASDLGRERSAALLAGFAAGMAAAVEYTAIIASALVLIGLLLARARRSWRWRESSGLAWLLMGAAAPLVVVLFYNRINFGSALSTAYDFASGPATGRGVVSLQGPGPLLPGFTERLGPGLVDLLRGAGHSVEAVGDGATAAQRGVDDAFDLVLLDLMLPRLDGVEVCRRLRQSRPGLPILMLTARGSEEDKVRGLTVGADDYVTKPFGVKELLARVDALARRARAAPAEPEALEADGCRIDFGRCESKRGRETSALTAREVGILRWLFRHRARAVTRPELLEQVWGMPGHLETRTVDVTISNLRQKIERNPAEPRIIVSVKGTGYAWGEK